MDDFFTQMEAALQPEPEPTDTPTETGAPETDVAEPVNTEPSAAEGAQDTPPVEADTPAQPQPSEDEMQRRATFAQIRRANEAAQAAERQLQEMQRRQDALARARGFDTFAALEAAVNAEAEQARNQALQSANLDPNVLQQYINDLVSKHPAVVAAEQMRQRAEETERAANMERGRKAFDDALIEIGKIDPSIKTAEDLSKMQNHAMFDDLVRKRGYGLVDAFKLANFEALQSRKAQEIKQATMNSVNGRSHLKNSAGAAGESAPVVPADVLAQYRAMLPDATDAEIRAHWAKSQK